jgi:inner membrane protein
MPTIFTHAAFAFGFSKLILDVKSNTTNKETGLSADEETYTNSIAANKRILFAASILAALPDADALLMRWIAYNHPLGHRGFTHSLCFAVIISFVVALLFTKLRWNNGQSLWTLSFIFIIASASHGFFDAMTTGGLGIAFFAPFDNTRYFFPFRPIPVAPLSAAGLFTARGLYLLIWELGLLWTFAIGAVIWNHQNITRKIVAVTCWLICLLMWIRKL